LNLSFDSVMSGDAVGKIAAHAGLGLAIEKLLVFEIELEHYEIILQT